MGGQKLICSYTNIDLILSNRFSGQIDPLVKKTLWSNRPSGQKTSGQWNLWSKGPSGQKDPLVKGTSGQRSPLVKKPLVIGTLVKIPLVKGTLVKGSTPSHVIVRNFFVKY